MRLLFPRAVLGQEVAEGLGNAPDLDADLLPVERDRFHHVRPSSA